MDREACLAYLNGLSRFPDQPGIYREEKLLGYLGNPESTFPIIHITGTNGKGSVSSMLAKVLLDHGWKVGLYSSPHLVDYPERIRVNESDISWDDFGETLQTVQEAVGSLEKNEGTGATQFDVLTALSFVHFAKVSVDIAIIEVGIGGTYDSTNVVAPILTIITNVGDDHLDKCGPTREDLARHKAGILKKGIPLVSGVAAGPLREIIRETAIKLSVPSYFIEEDWDVKGRPDDHEQKEWICFTPNSILGESLAGEYKIGLLGAYQQQNASIVLAGLTLLEKKGWVRKEQVKKSLLEVRWPGRFEIFRQECDYVVDGAHNQLGAEALRQSLDEWFPGRNCSFISGFLKGKNAKEFIETLERDGDTWYGVLVDSERGMSKSETISVFENRNFVWLGSFEEALKQKFPQDTVIVVCGSLYLVGPARTWLEEKSRRNDDEKENNELDL